MKRLGVVGTMVWDTIHGRDAAAGPVEEWGGIAYALAALEASLPAEWEFVPLIKVGRDAAHRANEFLRSLSHRAAASRFVEVTEPNNRVTLRYETETRRCEQLSGGVPGWTWQELGPMVRDLDAIYVNFISGFEMNLETAVHLRRGFSGPIYADLHSLFLGIGLDGVRVPRTLDNSPDWFSCFDVVQLNEDEFTLLGPDPLEVAARALGEGVRLLVVTLGERGAVYFTHGLFDIHRSADRPSSGPIRTARIATDVWLGRRDPTGCGDVFGATTVAHLVGGSDIESALQEANAMAGRNLRIHGATNLQYHLRGEIAPR